MTGSLVYAVLSLCRSSLCQWRLAARLRYGLVKVAALCFLIPVSRVVAAWLPSFGFSAILSGGRLSQTVAPEPLGVLGDAAGEVPWFLILAVVWMAGIGAQCLWRLLCFIRFRREARSSIRAADPVLLRGLERVKTKVGVSKNIEAFYPQNIASPIVVGLFVPKIILPLMEFSSKSAECIFTHELVHLKRKGLWMKAGFLALQTLHWFKATPHNTPPKASRLTNG